jgi:hypothetical protein
MGVWPHTALLAFVSAAMISRAQRLIQLSRLIMPKKWKGSNEKPRPAKMITYIDIGGEKFTVYKHDIDSHVVNRLPQRQHCRRRIKRPP